MQLLSQGGFNTQKRIPRAEVAQYNKFMDAKHVLSRLTVGLLGSLLVLSIVNAQEAIRRQSGLQVTVYAGEPFHSDRPLAARTSRRITPPWFLQADPAAEHPPATPLWIRWQGNLDVITSGVYRFACVADGRVRLEIDGQVVFDGQTTSHTETGPALDRSPASSVASSLSLRAGTHRLEFSLAPRRIDTLQVTWVEPGFVEEPLPANRLWYETTTHHERIARGAELIRVYRCQACHVIPGVGDFQRAPTLHAGRNQVTRRWLEKFLRRTDRSAYEHMPTLAMSDAERRLLQQFLGAQHLPESEEKGDRESGRLTFLTIGCLACHRINDVGRDYADAVDLTSVGEKRNRVFLSQYLVDPSKWFTDHEMPVFALTKRQRRDLVAYLASAAPLDARSDPASDGGAETADERIAPLPSLSHDELSEAIGLLERRRCLACHNAVVSQSESIQSQVEQARRRMSDRRTVIEMPRRATSYSGCMGKGDPAGSHPGFDLSQEDRQSIDQLLNHLQAVKSPRIFLAEEAIRTARCLHCHVREGEGGMDETLARVATVYTDLSPRLPALRPPSLNQVGDKLHRRALVETLVSGPQHRPWLQVRMPQLSMDKAIVDRLVDRIIDSDRLRPTTRAINGADPDPRELDLAGRRLITSAGFGCISCHTVGSVDPANVPLHARGPQLVGLGRRLRESWFRRWLRSPGRIVPRIEMPSVERPVAGVLGGDLGRQMTAMWHVLNQSDFQPPPDNPVRVVRQANLLPGEQSTVRSIVLTDILHGQGQKLFRPLLVALPNRNNILFDQATAKLSVWSVGDAAAQLTQGKTWYWQQAGLVLASDRHAEPELSLVSDGQAAVPVLLGQFLTRVDGWRHERGGAFSWRYRLLFRSDDRRQWVGVSQTVYPTQPGTAAAGWTRKVRVDGLRQGQQVVLRVADGGIPFHYEPNRVTWPGRGYAQTISRHQFARSPTGDAVLAAEGQGPSKGDDPGDTSAVMLELQYHPIVRVDQWHASIPDDSRPTLPRSDTRLRLTPPTPLRNMVPGFAGERIGIPAEIMPTSLAWEDHRHMIVTSLKGRVWRLSDQNGDGHYEAMQSMGEELAAPYGAFPHAEGVDVINKYALLRLIDRDRDGIAEEVVTLADGWGHTDDYHDWSIGLPPHPEGGYLVATACQQDERPPAAAALRGKVLRVYPTCVTSDVEEKEPTAAARRVEEDAPTPGLSLSRPFAIEVISTGHRFPMGIAVNRSGDAFVTDNQGNYNPFNELNHVRQGAFFGFVNGRDPPAVGRRPIDPPAIKIPHPWTRSVNGICFLDPPSDHPDAFGPFAGHLVGCEYDTRRLVRMTLQRCGTTYQGAVYPMSVDRPLAITSSGDQKLSPTVSADSGGELLGPLCCAVSPSGQLVVGEIRDSGWGAGNNVGSLVRLQFHAEQVPVGICQVRAVAEGFVVDFTRKVSTDQALDRQTYSLISYTRHPTPAYGGPDVDRRQESIGDPQLWTEQKATRVASSTPVKPTTLKAVLLPIKRWRTGYVYELQVSDRIAGDRRPFFPRVAYYTMNVAPAAE